MKNWSMGNIISVIGVIIAIIGVVVAILACIVMVVIPEIRNFFNLDTPTISNESSLTSEIEEIPTPTPFVENPAKASKCETIKSTFSQSLEGVRARFSLPSGERNFRLVYEECGSIATGFIFEGNTEFELSVPEGGCIDSYSGAYFSEQPVSHSFGGLRVYGGIVRATRVTYRVAWCETKQ